MSNTIETMVKHPIASIFIIGVTLSGVADVISAAKGNRSTVPKVNIQCTSSDKTK